MAVLTNLLSVKPSSFYFGGKLSACYFPKHMLKVTQTFIMCVCQFICDCWSVCVCGVIMCVCLCGSALQLPMLILTDGPH